jgi:uncharacterized membrane protein YhiD involved in acid resistance
MTEFRMPTDISEKEKIVGGLLTAGQLIWIAAGLGITVGVGFLCTTFMGGAGFILGALVGIPFGIAFAFYKPHKVPLITYIKLKAAHSKKVKHLINHDPEIDSIELDHFAIERL